MGRYILQRIVHLIPMLLLAAVFVFMMIRLIPGDPAMVMLGTEARAGEVEELRERLGLNQPIYTQFLIWFWNILHGDLGMSIVNGRPVLEGILLRLPVTFELAVAATIVSLLIGIPTGVIAATRQNSRLDWLFMCFALVGISIPNFWLGLMLMAVFAASLGWLPMVGWVMINEDPIEGLRFLILPALSLGAVQAAVVARMTRSSMLEVLREDYVRTARAKGLHDRLVVVRHALRNSMIPVTTAVGVNIAHLLGGAVAIETVFSIPGLGRFLIFSTLSRDYTSVQGILLLSVTIYVLINLLVDVLYVLFDPRIRYT